MLKKTKRILTNERGISFLEAGLYIILVVFVIGVGASGLGSTIAAKFVALTSSVNGVNIPSINP